MIDFTPEELSAAAELYPTLWILKHNIKNEVGTPIDFSKRKYLWTFTMTSPRIKSS